MLGVPISYTYDTEYNYYGDVVGQTTSSTNPIVFAIPIFFIGGLCALAGLCTSPVALRQVLPFTFGFVLTLYFSIELNIPGIYPAFILVAVIPMVFFIIRDEKTFKDPFSILGLYSATFDLLTDILIIIYWLVTKNYIWAICQSLILIISQLLSATHFDSDVKCCQCNCETLITWIGFGRQYYTVRAWSDEEYLIELEIMKVWELFYESFPSMMLQMYLLLIDDTNFSNAVTASMMAIFINASLNMWLYLLQRTKKVSGFNEAVRKATGNNVKDNIEMALKVNKGEQEVTYAVNGENNQNVNSNTDNTGEMGGHNRTITAVPVLERNSSGDSDMVEDANDAVNNVAPAASDEIKVNENMGIETKIQDHVDVAKRNNEDNEGENKDNDSNEDNEQKKLGANTGEDTNTVKASNETENKKICKHKYIKCHKCTFIVNCMFIIFFHSYCLSFEFIIKSIYISYFKSFILSSITLCCTIYSHWFWSI